MKTKFFPAILALLFASCSPTTPQNPAGPTDLERMKNLIGVWESDAAPGAPSEKVIYRITAGGSAVEETLFPGTPHQMTSVYHLVDDNLQMIHSCALGNKPKLAGERTDSGLHFTFVEGENITPGTGHYISELELTFLASNEIRHEWRSLKDGRPGETKIITFNRKS